jgi:hypothetical protein
MANIRGYEQTFNKTDIGLGVGGNPVDQTLNSTPLSDSKDTSGVTIAPPQPAQPRQLNSQDLLKLMNNEEL